MTPKPSRPPLAPSRAPAPPKVAEDRYRRRLRALVGGAIERAYQPLLAALPALSAAMAAQSDGARQDASPVDDAARLVKNGQSAFIMIPREARAAAGAAALNISSHTKTKVRRQLDEASDRRINAIKLTDSPRLKPLIDGFAAENVTLIKGISPRLAADVQGLVVQGLTNGVPAARLAEQIRARMDTSTQRAELIAIDQIGKLDGKLTEQRHRDLGVTHFLWHTSEDERVRGNPAGLYPKALPSHWDRNGKRYAYDDLPRGRNGEREVPGAPYRCRCWAEPDLSTLIGASSDPQATDQPAAAQDVDALEAEASRMMAEVETMLQRQQDEIERARRDRDAEAARREAEKLPDPMQEAAAQGLEMQLRMVDPVVTETALARHRRWKRRGRQVRGDQRRGDYNPDQPRAPDGRFGEVAGEHAGKTAPDGQADPKAQRQAKREEMAQRARTEATRRARMMRPDEWGGHLHDAERRIEDADYEIESATDDLNYAETSEDRESAIERIATAADTRAAAKAEARVFANLIDDNKQQPSENPDEDRPEGGHHPRRYPSLSPDVIAQYESSIAAIDRESARGMAKFPHPRVSVPDKFVGSKVGGIPIDELTHAFAPPEGFTAVVKEASKNRISMEIHHPNGLVGDIVRDFRPGGEIHHSLFVVDETSRGSGFADEVLGQSLLRYEKMGIKKVSVDAAWVGRYKWATVGFRFDERDSEVGVGRSKIEKKIESYMESRSVPDETRDQVRDLIDDPWKLARFTDGKEYPVSFQSGPLKADRSKGSFHLGKALLLQEDMPIWTGVLDIDRNNEGYLHALSKLKVETRK